MDIRSHFERGSLLFSFEDHRNVRLIYGKEHGEGDIIGPNGKIFNHIVSDTNESIRIKSLILSIFSAPSATLFEIPYRLFDLFTLGSISRGIDEGKYQFHKKILEGKDPNYHITIISSILYSLAKDIVQIATYPLYLVGRQFAAIWGVLFPLDGIYMVSTLQENWALDTRLIRNWTETEYLPIAVFKMYRLCPAYCMLSKQYVQKNNFYRFLPAYHPESSRSLLLDLENILERYASYFEWEDEYSLRDIEELLSWLKEEIVTISPSAHHEFRIEEDDCTTSTLLVDQRERQLDTVRELFSESSNEQNQESEKSKAIKAYRLSQLQEGLKLLIREAWMTISTTRLRSERYSDQVTTFHQFLALFQYAYQESENDWKAPVFTGIWNDFVEGRLSLISLPQIPQEDSYLDKLLNRYSSSERGSNA